MSRAPRLGLARIGSAEIAVGVALLAIGVVALAWVAGWIAPARPSGPPPGTVGVPAAGVPIAAYEQIELRHLISPATGDLAAVYLPEGSILPDTITRPEELLGRVLAADKPAGLLFTKHDFLPPGTRPGLVAGIPAGRRAMRIDAAQVSGIAGLARGDRFDLVATTAPPAGASASARSAARARSRLLVEGGSVVEPLAARQQPAANGPRVVEEMVIALAPDEVAALSEALAAGARVDAIPRSGRPDDADVVSPPRDGRSWDGLRSVERIVGSKRETLTVPEATRPLSSLDPTAPLLSAGALDGE